MDSKSPLILLDEGSLITLLSVTTSDPAFVLENLTSHELSSSLIAWQEIRKQAQAELDSCGQTLKQVQRIIS